MYNTNIKKNSIFNFKLIYLKTEAFSTCIVMNTEEFYIIINTDISIPKQDKACIEFKKRQF